MLQVKLVLGFSIAILCILEACAKETDGKIWVLLVAGSNTYSNYRHQADICHSYQVVKSRGIPDENIIVMMYDDIAENRRNPKKGEIFNKPDGPDVYKGVPTDYVGKEVTSENFLSILGGDSEKMKNIGTGKVIKSTANDHIFVFYSDHGGPGIIAFVEEVLYASDLLQTLQQMADNKQYSKMALFIEACYSGSMFENLLANNSGIYAMTAANAEESSYARYYDSKIRAYLGDEYSTKTLEYLDDGSNSTIKELFNYMKLHVTDSHVMEYGDLSVAGVSVSEFIGSKSIQKKYAPRRHHNRHIHSHHDTVSTLDVPIKLLQKEIEFADSDTMKEFYENELELVMEKRNIVRQIVDAILKDMSEDDEDKLNYVKKMQYRIDTENMHCAKAVTKAFHEHCFNIPRNPFVVSVIENIVKLCNIEWSTQERAIEVIYNVCTEHEKPTSVV